MTLRDLTPEEILVLQRQCTTAFHDWKARVGIRPASQEECFQAAWSGALKARLKISNRPSNLVHDTEYGD